MRRFNMVRFTAAVTTLFFAGFTVGCYNTYTVSKDEFAKAQRAPDDSRQVTLTDSEGTNVVVEDDTALYVRSTGGRRYPVTAFNYRLTQSQLVASDRDTLLALDELESYEVDHLSTWQTVLLASGGALAVAGVIVAIAVTAGTKTFGD